MQLLQLVHRANVQCAKIVAYTSWKTPALEIGYFSQPDYGFSFLVFVRQHRRISQQVPLAHFSLLMFPFAQLREFFRKD